MFAKPIEVTEQDLVLLYQRAKQGYQKCIFDAENEFLRDEVDYPLESILLMNEDIKIVFHKNVALQYSVEICFLLLAEENEIGKYTFVEDESGNVIDDFLVFY